MKRSYKSILSIMLGILMLMVAVLGIEPTVANADTVDDASEMRLLSESEISPFVDYANAVAKGHAGRAYREEDMNTIVYYNLDGTKTAYFFDQDVKYTDAEGNIVDKDIGLKSTTGGYTTKQNDIAVSLPQSVSSGIELSHNGNTIRLIPLPDVTSGGNITNNATVTSAIANMTTNKVAYNNVFGANTRLEYTPLLNGIKEDIVLESYTGTNVWRFIAQTNGLYAYQDDMGGYYFARSEDADDKYSLGDVYTYDSNGNSTYGTMTVTAVKPGAQYAVEISVDEDFLTSIDTVYPVYVDPEITYGSSGVYDAVLYSGKPNENFSSSDNMHIGYFSSSYGTARVAMRFNSLVNNSTFYSYVDDVVSADLYVGFGIVATGQSISVHQGTYQNWTNSNATWSNLANSYNSTAVTSFVPTSGINIIDFTEIVESWKGVESRLKSGVIFKMQTEPTSESYSIMSSAESNTVGYRPTLEVTYRTNLSKVFHASVSLYGGRTQNIKKISLYDNENVEYTTSDSFVANVNEDGIIAGISEGTATITIKVIYSSTYQPTMTCTVTVMSYESADAAALAFATEMYASCAYILHEYATMIYSIQKNGQTRYYYIEPYSGAPHSVVINLNLVPNYGIPVAFSHTHPHGNGFSVPDMDGSNHLGIDGYVNGPDCVVRRYDYGTAYGEGLGTIVDTMTPDPLSNTEKIALEAEFEESWYGHLTDCNEIYDAQRLGCSNLPWPKP